MRPAGRSAHPEASVMEALAALLALLLILYSGYAVLFPEHFN